MRTEMHQDAFPGEDISDRPEPAASVPGLLALIEGDAPERALRGTRLRARGIEAAMIDATTTIPTGAAVPYERLDFVLDAEHEAHEPPEVGEGRRDDVRLLVSVGDAAPGRTRASPPSESSSPPATSSW